jgi:plastin-1
LRADFLDQRDASSTEIQAHPDKDLLQSLTRSSSSLRFYRGMLTNTQDGEAYTVLLHALAPEVCDLSPLKAATPEERAKLLLQQAEKLDVRKYVQAKDIVEGHQNLNLAFVANLFHTRYGDFSLGLFLIVSSSFFAYEARGTGVGGSALPGEES